MLAPFETVEIEHIPRGQNTEADALARKALERARQVDAELPPEARKRPQPKTFRLK
jgi:ribonuclease HI